MNYKTFITVLFSVVALIVTATFLKFQSSRPAASESVRASEKSKRSTIRASRVAPTLKEHNLHLTFRFRKVDADPVDFSSDDQLLAMAGGSYGGTRYPGGTNGFVQIFKLANGELIHTLYGHTDVVYSAIFSPDRKVLASGSRDKTLRLWDVKTGKLQYVLAGHKADVIALAFSSDGKLLASGSRDNTIRLWNVKTGKMHRLLGRHKRSVYSVAFSQDGTMLASGSWDGALKLWNLNTGKLLWTQVETNPLYQIAFSKDAKSILDVLQNSTVHVRQTRTGQLQKALADRYGWSGLDQANFSSDGRFLARLASVPLLLGGGTVKAEVQVTDTQNSQVIARLIESNGELGSPVLSHNGKLLAVGVANSTQNAVNVYAVDRDSRSSP